MRAAYERKWQKSPARSTTSQGDSE
jgi:hypothetical protein